MASSARDYRPGEYLHLVTIASCTPKTEARAIFKMLGRGATVESLIQLISTPPAVEARLRAFAQQCPEQKAYIEKILAFRAATLDEFLALVAAAEGSTIADPPELPLVVPSTADASAPPGNEKGCDVLHPLDASPKNEKGDSPLDSRPSDLTPLSASSASVPGVPGHPAP